jgi:hypothetical protein
MHGGVIVGGHRVVGHANLTIVVVIDRHGKIAPGVSLEITDRSQNPARGHGVIGGEIVGHFQKGQPPRVLAQRDAVVAVPDQNLGELRRGPPDEFSGGRISSEYHSPSFARGQATRSASARTMSAQAPIPARRLLIPDYHLLIHILIRPDPVVVPFTLTK